MKRLASLLILTTIALWGTNSSAQTTLTVTGDFVNNAGSNLIANNTFAGGSFALDLLIGDPPSVPAGAPAGFFFADSASITVTGTVNENGTFAVDAGDSILISNTGDLSGFAGGTSPALAFTGTSLTVDPLQTSGFNAGLFTAFDPANDNFAVASTVLALFDDSAASTLSDSLTAQNVSLTVSTAAVPEPSSIALLGLGVAAFAGRRRRSL